MQEVQVVPSKRDVFRDSVVNLILGYIFFCIFRILGKRPKTASKNCRTVNSNRDSRKAVHSAPRENTVTINNVHRIAETLQENISQFSEMMSKLEGIQNKQVKKYKCLLSETHLKKRGDWEAIKNHLKSIKRRNESHSKSNQPAKNAINAEK